MALDRDLLGPLEPTDREITTQLDRAYQWDHSPVTGPRILQINEMATDYFEKHYVGSWAQLHLHQRLGQHLAGDDRFRPGYAPAGWTNLVNHLRTQGVSDNEMLAAGVATTATTGQLIDRFRDRAILPIISRREVLGFVGRRHPDFVDGPTAGPKYLNTADTIAFHKGAQLYGLADQHMARGAIPVLVEGPIDAIAVTIASAGAYLGVAPLGTSLTQEQSTQLARLGNGPIIATDGDLAGRIAAERDYWLLTAHLAQPKFARFSSGEDPAGMLEAHGPARLVLQLQQARPLAEYLLAERFANVHASHDELSEIAKVIAARPAHLWELDIASVAETTGCLSVSVAVAVVDAAQMFNDDRRRFTEQQINATAQVRARVENSTNAAPAERWAPLARTLDSRLLAQVDWPATAAMVQRLHDTGLDVPMLAQHLIEQRPLGTSPASDLRYRLAGCLPDEPHDAEPLPGPLERPSSRRPPDANDIPRSRHDGPRH